LHYLDVKRKIDQTESVFFTAVIQEGATPVDWNDATAVDMSVDELEKQPETGAQFKAAPAAAANAKNYAGWKKSFTNWLFQTQQLTLLRSPSLDALSQPGEAEREFRIHLQQTAREERDRLAEALKQKYAPKFAALAERKRRAALRAEEQKAQQSQALLQTAVSVGTGLLSAFLGRKTFSAATISKASTAARQAGRSWKESQDVSQANETVEQLMQQASELQAQFDAELAAQQSKVDPASEQFETIPVRLKKTNIEVQLVALVWKPESRTQSL
jgi:hypothetical protein